MRVFDVSVWGGGEWVSNLLTWPFTVAKILFVLGVGVRVGEGRRKAA
jgi:hypothetical protein